MAERIKAREQIPMPDAAQVGRAIRLTYAQMMLFAIFAASTGGMFLVGFAMELGAGNVLLGVMAGVPQAFVIGQFLAAYVVERGVSRKKITVVFSFLWPLSWFLVAIIAFFGEAMGTGGRMAVLIGVICLVTLSAQFVTNARQSWIGELIPAGRRGRFFGYCSLFGGIVGSAFAIVEGGLLDRIESYGLVAFMGLFFFGAVFGLVFAALHIPQPDCPLPGEGKKPAFWALARETLRNRQFVLLAFVNAVLAMTSIAAPFGNAYCLRDVGVSFFGLGVLNSIFVAAMLLSSAYWGKLADRFGCRPILILGLLLMAPCSVTWLFIPSGSPQRAYMLMPLSNFVAGLGSAAVGISLQSMMYKLSRPEGRSVQFATYNVFVTLASLPMPILGGWLVTHLEGAGYAVDLRLTFYLWSAFVLAAAALAWFLHEPESMRTRALVFSYFPNQLARFWGFVASRPLLFFSAPAPRDRRPK